MENGFFVVCVGKMKVNLFLPEISLIKNGNSLLAEKSWWERVAGRGWGEGLLYQKK